LLAYPQITLAETLYDGVAAGDATNTSAILWTRTYDSNSPGGIATELTAQVAKNPTFNPVFSSFSGKTNPDKDYTLKIDATGLQSGTQYYYRFKASDSSISRIGKFKTAPDKNQSVPVRFGFSGDADGQWRPYGSTKEFCKLNLDYFVFLGDTIYETKNAKSPATADPFLEPTKVLADYHRKYRENVEPVQLDGFPSLQTMFAAQGNYTLLDNHELGNRQFIDGGAPAGVPEGKGADATDPENDVNKTGKFINKTPGFKYLIQAYSDYEPIREKTISTPNDPRTDRTQQLYFAQQWGKNSIFINVDDRSYRDIRIRRKDGRDDTGKRADNLQRTMLGATQLKWLKKTLVDAQANHIPWKIIAVSSPIDQLGLDGGKSWMGGYRAERNEILKFIADRKIDNVVFITTDDHQNRVNELTYLADINNPQSMTIVPHAFTIVAGPIGAGGPDLITDHSFTNLKSLSDSLASKEKALGIDPIGLDPKFPGLKNVFREDDPQANTLRQPIDFYSPDTFNYVTLDISADGETLSVNTYGINSYPTNTFPEPEKAGNIRHILGFQIQRDKPKTKVFLGLVGLLTIIIALKPQFRQQLSL
jgi:phosphodiesterase/alkaline phosphatase D-like protein